MEGQRSSVRGSGVPGATDVEIEGVGLGVERRGEAGGWRLATMARWRHKPNWRPHDIRYDAAAVARPQGEGTRGRDDDVGGSVRCLAGGERRQCCKRRPAMGQAES